MMCWFKKKLFKITWKYGSTSTVSYTEIVKARDIADAWAKIGQGHGIAISLESWEEVS